MLGGLTPALRYYGDALRELGGIRQEAEFVEAALLRYDTALELNSHNVKALHSRAKAQLDLVRAHGATLMQLDQRL